jgi:hypothetical protein
VDFYNLLNAATPLSYNQAFIPGGAWLTPTVGAVRPVLQALDAAGLLETCTQDSERF